MAEIHVTLKSGKVLYFKTDDKELFGAVLRVSGSFFYSWVSLGKSVCVKKKEIACIEYIDEEESDD